MSGSSSGADQGTNPAEAEFQRYKARMAGASPVMVPVMMGPGGYPGWAVPPSLASFGAVAQRPPGATAGSIGERLGLTLQLGIDFLNGLLASGAGTFGSAAAMLPQGRYGGSECGCGCDCGSDCCAMLGCDCCRPGLSGCCR